MKKLFFLLIWILILQTSVYAAPGDILIDESFNSRSMINEAHTNAVVDTSRGEVYLPKHTGIQTMGANQDGLLIVNGNSIDFYNFDGSQYIPNPYLSYSISENPIAIALTPHSYEHYVLDGSGVLTTYRYTGGNFIDDPAYQLTGFSSALSISRSEESLFVLDDREIRVYKDTGNGFVEVPDLNIMLDIDNPIQIETVNEDIVVLDQQGNIHYFRFGGSFYEEDPAVMLLDSSIGIDSSDSSIYSIQTDQVETYTFSESTPIYNEYLSFDHSGVVSVANIGDDQTVFVRDDGGVTVYVFDGTKMVPIQNISGINQAASGYLSPRQVQTKLHSWPDATQRISVEPTMILPDGTAIDFYISSDGVSFSPIDPSGVFEFGSPVTQCAIKAVLSTTNLLETPVLQHIRVIDKSLSIEYLETTRIVRDPGGNPPLPTRLPVNVTGGYNFDMKVEALGAINVLVEFSNGESLYLDDQGGFIFTGTHHFPEDFTGSVDVKITAADDDGNIVEKEFLAHYMIPDNINNNITIYDLK